MAPYSLPDIVELAFALLASGVLAGLLVGLFGAYGGLVIVPVLHPMFATLGMQNSVVVYLAAGVSLVLLVFTALQCWRETVRPDTSGGISEHLGVDVRWLISAGAVSASVVVAALPVPEVQLIFTCVMLAGGVKMLFPFRLAMSVVVRTMMASPLKASLDVGPSSLSVSMGAGGGNMRSVAFDLRRADAPAGPVQKLAIGAFGLAHSLWEWSGRTTGASAVASVLLAVPAMAGLGMVLSGHTQASGTDEHGILGVAVILASAMMLVPVGAELSRQFSRRLLEISLGVFLLLASAQFAWFFLA
ncbi:hypothetical protein [Azorhizobium oxalatiphilum]|nr:hypothetical protein [Azorhizobium oxalatiphilum]